MESCRGKKVNSKEKHQRTKQIEGSVGGNGVEMADYKDERTETLEKNNLMIYKGNSTCFKQSFDFCRCERVDELVLLKDEYHPPSLLAKTPNGGKYRYLHLIVGNLMLILFVVVEGYPDVEQRDESARPTHAP